MLRRLIVNADDLGSGEERDRGIMASFVGGIVTSASILANGPSFHTAIQGAREIALPLGVHLNLSEGEALTGAIPGLTDSNGFFPGKSALRSYLAAGKIDAVALYRELAAQIERVFSAGIIPDHLDTHQHFSLFPAVTPIILRLVEEFSLPALRLPLPGEAAADDPDGELGRELDLYRRLAPVFAVKVKTTGILTPSGLFGMPLLNRLNASSLAATLQMIPEGCWELMVHPGFPAQTSSFAGTLRHEELMTLTSSAIAEEMELCGITPISYHELICGS